MVSTLRLFQHYPGRADGLPVADTAALRLDDIRHQFKLWLPRRDNRERFGCAGQIK